MSGKHFESQISKSHGFIYGEGSSQSKTELARCENITRENSENSERMQYTKFSSYDIKVRRRRTCQLKVLVVFLAILAAACIGCVIAYFFIKYNGEHEKYLKYTQNMVAERNCNLKKSNNLFYYQL
jgi:hypothetical protein